MPYRQRFKELLDEAKAAGLLLDDEQTSYLTTEHAFVTKFVGDDRTFVVTDQGAMVTRLTPKDAVDHLITDKQIPDLEDAYAKGSPFKC